MASGLNDHYSIKVAGLSCLYQQRYREDHVGACGLRGGFVHFVAYPRMHDGFQCGPFFRVGKNQFANRCAIQMTVCVDHGRPQQVCDLGHRVFPSGCHLMGITVGIQNFHAECLKIITDCGLAAADASGEGDFQHTDS